MTTPLLSVVVCTYNGAETIRECLESLRPQRVEESYEVLVVDDGSTDGTRKIVEEMTDEIISLIEHDENRGLSAARNTGWQTADGEFVAYIDDDATAPPDWVQSLLDGYDEGIDALGGYSTPYHDHPVNRYEVARTKHKYGPDAEDVEGAGGMNMSFRRSVLAEVGGFDERFTHIGDDADLNKRLTEAGYNLRVDPLITVAHQYPTSVTSFARKMFKRGKGRVVMDEKHDTESPVRVLALALLAPLLLPYTSVQAVGCAQHGEISDLPWFLLLAYLEGVFERWGTAYFLFSGT